MYDDQYWDLEFSKVKEQLDQLLNTGQITQGEYNTKLEQAKTNTKGSSWMASPITY